MFLLLPPKPEAGDLPERPARRPLWRRAVGVAPWWAWAVAAGVQLAVALPFWLSSSPAPYHDFHGDLYRGWPAIYGLDQGDVGGDEWGPFVTYFHPARFALDSAVAVACGLPATGLVLWFGWRFRRRVGGRAEPPQANK